MKGIVFRVFAALLSLICFVLCLEVLLRLDFIQLGSFYSIGGFHELDEEMGWRQKPNLHVRFRGGEWDTMIKTNSHGFRASREYPFEKPHEKKRILVLGDSFVWGWGVENEEMFTEIMEKELGGGTEILNAGHTGFDTLQEYLLYKRMGILYEPDLVLLCFFPNDIADIAGSDELKPKASIENGQLVLSGRTGLQDPVDILWWEIKRYSKGLQYLEYVGSLISHVSRRIKWAREANANEDDGGLVEEAATAPYDYPVEYKIPQPAEFDMAWRIVGRVVAEMNEMQRKIGGDLKVVIVPEKRLVSADSQVLAHPQEHGNLMLMHEKMREICGPLGIEIIDMLPGFREDPDPLHFYFRGDTHWNPEGHRRAAKILLGRENLF